MQIKKHSTDESDVSVENQEEKTSSQMSSQTSSHEMRELDSENFTQFIEGGERVLIDFWAPRCRACQSQMALLDTMIQSRSLPDGVSAARVNVDEHPALAEEYGISAIPTMILFRRGKAVRRYVGILRPENISAALGGV